MAAYNHDATNTAPVGTAPDAAPPAGASWSTPGIAWTRTPAADWDDGPHRVALFAGLGLAGLASLALAVGIVRALWSPAADSTCATADACTAEALRLTQAEKGAASAAPQEDLERAAQLFQKACDWGDAEGCHHLGLAHQAGRGVPEDAASARLAFERGCNDSFAEACNNLGALYEHGHGVAANLGDALRWYGKACNQGSGLGCSNLGSLYATGRGVRIDLAEAERLFSKACDAGSYVGCQNLLSTRQF